MTRYRWPNFQAKNLTVSSRRENVTAKSVLLQAYFVVFVEFLLLHNPNEINKL